MPINKTEKANTKARNNRVWIELEFPRGGNEEGERRAHLASVMLKKLGYLPNSLNAVSWHSTAKAYCFIDGEAGGFYQAEDCGFWFNLDVLGSESR